MFENIIGHGAVVDGLREALLGDRLPAALLLAGEPCVGKGTLAHEVARVVTCERDGAWDCACAACASQRLLTNPDTITIGTRDFVAETAAAARAYERAPRQGTRFLAIRAARKLLRRFDGGLVAEQRLARLRPHIVRLAEAVEAIEGAESPSASDVLALVPLVRALREAAPADLAAVDAIRFIASWAHLSPTGVAKVVIVEDAHRLLDSARNAMLKTLEEPPASTRFILTTTRRSAIMPTILSRVRTIALAPRTGDDNADVITRVFRALVDDRSSADLQRFIVSEAGFDPKAWERAADAVIDGARDARATWSSVLRSLPDGGDRATHARGLVAALVDRLRAELVVAGPRDVARIAAIRRAVDHATVLIETRNMNPTTVLAGLGDDLVRGA